MPVSGNYSNYGQVGQQYQQQQQNRTQGGPPKESGAISFTHVTITQDKVDFQNYGARYEASNQAFGTEAFTVDGIAGITAAGHTEGNFHSSIGVGAKASLNVGTAISLYGSAMGTANYTLADGNHSGGVGYRLAYGAEVKMMKAGIYGEMFTEKATNYDAKGYAVGAKFYF